LRLLLDLILVHTGHRELLAALRRIRSGGLHIPDDLPKCCGIVDPVRHACAANEAKSFPVDAELLQHSVKLL
jgi:hypothetical protein